MKVNVLLGNPTSTDITKEDMLEQWALLGSIPNVEYVIKETKGFPDEDEFNQMIDPDCDAVLGCWITKRFINERFFESHPKCKYIAGGAHGYEQLDWEMTRRYGVTITNTTYGDSTIAEFAFALLMDICHKVSWHSDYIKKTDWLKPDHPKYMYALTKQLELRDMTLGILGLGKIGYHTALIGRGFGMKVLAHSRHKKEGPQYDFIQQVSFDELLAQSDVISLHTPLTPATENIIDRNAFAKMKDNVILINTARGKLIEEEALIDALKSGKVYAAGLDTMVEEPPRKPNELLTLPNTTITGHIAWLPKTARLRQASLAVENYRSYLEGKPVSVINGMK